MWYVYLLLCDDGSFYTGSTDNLERRFSEHKGGKGGRYTRNHPPLQILYSESYTSKQLALKRKKQIKGWSHQKKIRILGLIQGLSSQGSSVG